MLLLKRYRQWGYIRRVFGGFLDFSQKLTWKAQISPEPAGVEKTKPYVLDKSALS